MPCTLNRCRSRRQLETQGRPLNGARFAVQICEATSEFLVEGPNNTYRITPFDPAFKKMEKLKRSWRAIETPHPSETWMLQMLRNLTDPDEPFLRRTRFLIMDRDTKYSQTFRAALTRERIAPRQLPPRSPNLNAFAERFVRSVKEECVGRMIFCGRTSLERAMTQYMAHYHRERNHQGIGDEPINRPTAVVRLHRDRVERRQRLGGMLNFYYREAA
jgi:hypothetical protein